MRIRLDKLNGNDNPVEHRILNLLLLIGITLSMISTVVNYLIGVGTEMIAVNICTDAILLVFYYTSAVLKKSNLVASLAVFTMIFVFTPSMWLYNGGLLGGSTAYVIFFSSAIALVLNGFRRIAAIGCLIAMILVLVFLEYHNPSMIIGYSSDLTHYSDVAINLIIVLVTNASAFGLFLNYYIKEQQKSREYLLQAEKQKMDSALSRFDRLNLIGEIAASIGHEVRNPMTTVRGYLQLYQKKYEQHTQQFDLMIAEIDRANAIITEFLSLAKNKRVDLKVGNLNTTITNLFPLLQADAFRTGHYLNLQTCDIPDILFDDNEIRQLLLNLFRNALEATPERCTVTIATKLEDQCVQLSVRDTGPGLPELVLENIGKPFITTKETGTGLGLPVCYSIAKRHNAEIDVETGAGGTTFLVKFKLPA